MKTSISSTVRGTQVRSSIPSAVTAMSSSMRTCTQEWYFSHVTQTGCFIQKEGAGKRNNVWMWGLVMGFKKMILFFNLWLRKKNLIQIWPQQRGGVITSKQKDIIANQKPEEKQRGLKNHSAAKKGIHVCGLTIGTLIRTRVLIKKKKPKRCN